MQESNFQYLQHRQKEEHNTNRNGSSLSDDLGMGCASASLEESQAPPSVSQRDTS